MVEVLRIIAADNNTKGIRCDGFPVRVWMCVADRIAYLFRNIIKSYMGMGKLPQKFQMSNIAMVHKKGDSTSYYMPISILPALSKVFETVLKTQHVSHLTKHNIIPACQHELITNLRL